MVINPYSVRSSPQPLRKNEGATSTPAPETSVETVAIGSAATSPAKRSLCTRALLGAGAAVALAVAIGGCAPSAAPLSVSPLVPGSSYQVSHQVVRRTSGLGSITDMCRFEGPDGTYVVDDSSGGGETSRWITVPGGTPFKLGTRSPYLDHYKNLTAEGKTTLEAIASYCLQTEGPADISHTTVTIPLYREGPVDSHPITIHFE